MGKRHHTKDQGDLAVTKIIAHLAENNIRVCLPLSEHLPFDLIAVMPDMKTLWRMQVKYRTDHYKNGTLEIRFRSNYYDSKKIYAKDVDLTEMDCYAIHNGENGENYYFHVDDIPQGKRGISLRYQPAKNNQSKNVHYAECYVDPKRIDPNCEPIKTYKRQVREKDEVAIAKTIEFLQECGTYPFIPTSQYVPFDLLAVLPDMQTIKRLRVRHTSVKVSDNIDEYVIYNANTNSLCFISAELYLKNDV